jgi:hypothetical protein
MSQGQASKLVAATVTKIVLDVVNTFTNATHNNLEHSEIWGAKNVGERIQFGMDCSFTVPLHMKLY